MAPSEAGLLYAEAAACLRVGFLWGIRGLELGGGGWEEMKEGAGQLCELIFFFCVCLKRQKRWYFYPPLISCRSLRFPAKREPCWCQCWSDGDERCAQQLVAPGCPHFTCVPMSVCHPSR